MSQLLKNQTTLVTWYVFDLLKRTDSESFELSCSVALNGKMFIIIISRYMVC